MAARRPSSVCALCQARQLALSRRCRTSSTKRHLQTAVVALRPEDDTFSHDLGSPLAIEDNGRNKSTSIKERIHETIDELREAALSLNELYQQRHQRIETLRKLRNPFPETPKGRNASAHAIEAKSLVLPEANAALVPHAVFRQNVKMAPPGKPMRQILRAQLLRCEYPREVLRIVAVAMMDRTIAENLALLSEPIMRAAYRCRQNVSDPEVLKLLTTILTRFQYAKLRVAPQLLFMALKFAARARSLPAMQKHLRSVRQANLSLSSNMFRSVIAKCSIGHRGLGEIRNGRWKRRDLVKVLTGFDDEADLPTEQRNHLGVFLDRTDWQYLHGWVAVLARCKDSEAVWREWLLWKNSPPRSSPRTLVFMEPGTKTPMTTRTRGDYWFLEQATYAGDLAKAWQILEETGIRLSSLKTRVKDKLLESIEYATTFNEDLREDLLAKYDRDLAKIEKALGVKWVSQADGEDGEGQHELFMDQEEALEKLGEDDWKLDDDYGYPWETDPIVPKHEQGLHDAVARDYDPQKCDHGSHHEYSTSSFEVNGRPSSQSFV